MLVSLKGIKVVIYRIAAALKAKIPKIKITKAVIRVMYKRVFAHITAKFIVSAIKFLLGW
jgi:hypothetical protein